MAVGAITVQKQGVIGNMKYAIVDVVGATSYTTTGDALDLFAVAGFTNIISVTGSVILPQPVVTRVAVEYDATNKKLQCFGTSGGATGTTECTGATNLSAQKYRLFVIGS